MGEGTGILRKKEGKWKQKEGISAAELAVPSFCHKGGVWSPCLLVVLWLLGSHQG